MKKLIPAFFLVALFLNPLYPVFAETATMPGAIRNELREAKEVRQEKVSEVRANIASREAALKQKLQQFRNKEKANIAERISTNLNKINERRTGEMLNNLERMAGIVSKLEAKVNESSSKGKDTTTVSEAISKAKAKIEVAKAAATTQKGKDYTVNATTEDKLKTDVSASRNLLHQDLLSVHNLVVDARKGVADAIKIAVKELASGGE